MGRLKNVCCCCRLLKVRYINFQFLCGESRYLMHGNRNYNSEYVVQDYCVEMALEVSNKLINKMLFF